MGERRSASQGAAGPGDLPGSTAGGSRADRHGAAIEGGGDAYSADQLAAEVGVPVSTVRMYQHRGLLPPPQRRGRQALYGPVHLARLRQIQGLQERGWSLAAIGDLLDGWQEGRGLPDLLGLTGDRSLWGDEEPIELTAEELRDRFPNQDLTAEQVQRAITLGLVEPGVDGRVRVLRPSFLEVGSRLRAMGVPAAEILDEYEALRDLTDEAARRFTELFRRHLWRSAPEGDPMATDLPRVAAVVDQLGPLARDVVVASLAHSLQGAARRFLDEEAARLAGG